MSGLGRRTAEGAGCVGHAIVNAKRVQERDDQLARAELQHLKAQLRFDDRLRVIWNVTPEAQAAQVPHLLLQPLVENAIRHGIAPRSDPGSVEIAAFLRDGALHLSVADDGVGYSGHTVQRTGAGLSNTRDRLRQLYSAAHSLTVDAVAPHGLRVDIVLPFREAAVA